MDADTVESELSVAAALATTPLSGSRLAGLVDQHLAALWRGDEAADSPFFAWLASCWRMEPIGAPVNGQRARSVLAAGGLGITWIETNGAILGSIQGHQEGHYRVSAHATPPSDERATVPTDPRRRPLIR